MKLTFNEKATLRTAVRLLERWAQVIHDSNVDPEGNFVGRHADHQELWEMRTTAQDLRAMSR